MEINAVFEGGGMKGISLAGAVCAAEKHGVSFRQVAGTSSGAVVSALIAAGFGAEQLKRIMETTPFRSFLKRSPLFELRVIGPVTRLLLKKGLYSGEALEAWIGRLLAQRGVRTFGDLKPGRLRIVASDISNGRLLVLPDDLQLYGIDAKRFDVAKAVRMSCAIPYFFDPVLIRQRAEDRGDGTFRGRFAHIVDGALLSNYPLWLFGREEEAADKQQGGEGTPTVGFRMVGQNANEPRNIRGPFSMLQAIFETMMQAHDERYIERQDQDRTVKIPTLGVRSTQFDLSPGESLALFQSGYDAADAYFRTFRRMPRQ